MAKRFTDTDKWKDVWFEELSGELKLFFFYFLDNCDCAGVWKGSFRQFAFFSGFTITKDQVLKSFGEKIIELENGSFFMPNFITFQYGKLSKFNNAHKGVLKSLDYNKIETSPYLAPSEPHYSGAQDKDKDKDKDKDNIIQEEIKNEFPIKVHRISEIQSLFNQTCTGNKFVKCTVASRSMIDSLSAVSYLLPKYEDWRNYFNVMKDYNYDGIKDKIGLMFLLSDKVITNYLDGKYRSGDKDKMDALWAEYEKQRGVTC